MSTMCNALVNLKYFMIQAPGKQKMNGYVEYNDGQSTSGGRCHTQTIVVQNVCFLVHVNTLYHVCALSFYPWLPGVDKAQPNTHIVEPI